MSLWQDLVKSVAPTLGTALGGPAAGMAVKFMADKLLGDPDASESDVAQYVEKASHEELLQLKGLDQQFAIRMRELDIDLFKAELADRQNARDILKFNMWPQVVFSALFVLGYFTIMAVLMSVTDLAINDRMFGILNTVIGVLTASVPQILQFWFGSSQGSKEKDKKGIPRG